jgi:hypothetical protein
MTPTCASLRHVLICALGAASLASCSGPASTAKGAQPAQGEASRTAFELSDQVTSLRVFLTENPAVVIGRIRIHGKTILKELEIPLDRGTVRFADDGRAPDLAAGDGEFSARFAMDTRAEFVAKRDRLVESTTALAEAKQGQWFKRGPRDLVTAPELLASLRKTPGFRLDALQERTRLLRDAKDPMDAARRVPIDFHATPFLEFPVWAVDPSRFEAQRMFDLPVFELFRFPPVWFVNASRSLSVTATGVVEDPSRTYDGCTGVGTPGGPWSFGHLMRELSNGSGLTPEDFTLQWISTWLSPQTVNDVVVDASRATFVQTRIIDSWQALSGPTLNVDRFPARLLAIVNRPDLADRVGYGAAGSAGEGRLVFGLQRRTASGACLNERFTVIFEYGIRGSSCTATRLWHRRWRDLGALTPGSTAYNSALEALTREFTDHGSNPAQLPNQSSLNQLRTNQAFDTIEWEQREFRLRGTLSGTAGGTLGMVPVRQTPQESLNNSLTLSDWVDANESSILADRHVLPAKYPGALDAFLSPASRTTSPSVIEHWNVDMTRLADPAETRRKFSLNTCDACHGGETATIFLHIGLRDPGAESTLSGFLTGIDVNVPVTHGTHHYHDLAERARKLDDIVSSHCFAMLALRKPFVH